MERNPREPELIQTIRSGGYMFSPEIERPVESAAP
jgi:two-component system OmpR family response regulator